MLPTTVGIPGKKSRYKSAGQTTYDLRQFVFSGRLPTNSRKRFLGQRNGVLEYGVSETSLLTLLQHSNLQWRGVTCDDLICWNQSRFKKPAGFSQKMKMSSSSAGGTALLIVIKHGILFIPKTLVNLKKIEGAAEITYSPRGTAGWWAGELFTISRARRRCVNIIHCSLKLVMWWRTSESVTWQLLGEIWLMQIISPTRQRPWLRLMPA